MIGVKFVLRSILTRFFVHLAFILRTYSKNTINLTEVFKMAMTRKKSSNKGWIVGVGLGLLAIAVVAVPMLGPKDETRNYRSATVSKETIETFYTFTGSVKSRNTQAVMAEKILQIAEIKAVEGAKVIKGDVLFVASDKSEVKAKIDGTVSAIHVEADEQVMSGALLCDIIDFEHLQVSVRVDEYDLDAIAEGDTIDVTINALDKDVTGTVASLSDTAVNQNGVSFFTATVDLEQDEEIKIGMTAEARIQNEESVDALTLPMKALMFDEENNPYVYSRNQDGTMTKTAVIVGIQNGKTAEVTNGVRDGETVYYSKTEDAGQTDAGFMPPMPGR